ncbi:MAG TPA: serine hydrolase domain-containing protein [Thermomicrobiales bacterium]|nr:serine hydrolase domain-containing protein [Thermomicrobiales bacterium]
MAKLRYNNDLVVLGNRRMTRRTGLKAGAAGFAAMLTATGFGQRTIVAQDGTPSALPASETMEDLTGVTPLPLTGERLASFEAYVAALLAEMGIPGAAVAVVQGGEIAFLQGFGVREIDRPEPVTADTLLRIGSVTKSFSSLLSATVVDTGRLEWETPLVELLPDFAVSDPDLTPQLTVQDAFSASIGLPRRDWELILDPDRLTPEIVVASLATLPLTAPYGEQYQYNNQMVATGGFAAAVADGGSPIDLARSYEIALRERVLEPIGMRRSTLLLTDVVADDDHATPHAQDLTGTFHPLPLMEDDAWIVPVAPTGGLWSSAREMAHYIQTQLSRGVSPDGGRVASAANIERTWQPGVAFPPPPPGTPAFTATIVQHYALGWISGAFGGQRLVSHGGATLGFTSQVAFLPEGDLGVVVLTNGAEQGLFGNVVMLRLLEIVFDLPPRIDDMVSSALPGAASSWSDLLAQLGPVDPEVVTPHLGHYANPDLGEMKLALHEGALIFSASGFTSEIRPQMDASGAVVDYRFIDPPVAHYTPSLILTLAEDANGQPQPELRTPGDFEEGELVYPFAPR